MVNKSADSLVDLMAESMVVNSAERLAVTTAGSIGRSSWPELKSKEMHLVPTNGKSCWWEIYMFQLRCSVERWIR